MRYALILPALTALLITAEVGGQTTAPSAGATCNGDAFEVVANMRFKSGTKGCFGHARDLKVGDTIRYHDSYFKKHFGRSWLTFTVANISPMSDGTMIVTTDLINETSAGGRFTKYGLTFTYNPITGSYTDGEYLWNGEIFKDDLVFSG